MPEQPVYQLLALGVERRLNLSEVEGQGLNVNFLLEDMGTTPGLVVGPVRSAAPRRMTIAGDEFQAALKRTLSALVAAA